MRQAAEVHGRQATRLLTCLALGGILIAAAWLRWRFGAPLLNPDEFAYVNGALDVDDHGARAYLGRLSPERFFAIYENRLSIVFPLAAGFRLLGHSETALSAICLVFSLGTVASAFLLGAQSASARVGLIAATLAAAIPQDVWRSLTAEPDNVVPCYVGFALVSFAAGQRSSRPTGRALLFAASGLFAFCAFEARVTSAVVLLPLGVCALWSQRRSATSLLLPGVAFAACLVLGGTLLWATSGDFLTQLEIYRVTAVAARFSGDPAPAFVMSTLPVLRALAEPGWLADQLAGRPGWAGPLVVFNPAFGPLFYLAWPAALFVAWKAPREERYRLPLLSFALLYAFFEVGSTSLTSYEPFWKVDRYLSILSVPAAVLIALALDGLASAGASRARRLGAGSLLAATTACQVLLLAVASPAAELADVDAIRQTIRRLKELEARTVYVTHWRWSLRGRVFARMQPAQPMTFRKLARKSLDELGPSYVIFDPSFFTADGEYQISWAPFDPALRELPGRLPPGWAERFRCERPRPLDDPSRSTPVYVFEVLDR